MALAEEGMVPLKLMVEPTWNGVPFNKNTTYFVAETGHRIRVNELKFYLAPLEIATAETTVQLFDVALFSLENGPEERWLSIPAGEYGSLHFGLGLPYALNHRDLATIPPNAPTGNNSGMYWEWGTQYRFVVWSGRWDSDPGGAGELPFIFDLHTGLDTCYRTRTIPMLLHAVPGDTAHLRIDVDLARFFGDGEQTLDLSEGSTWHGDPQFLPLALKVADLQVAAISWEP